MRLYAYLCRLVDPIGGLSRAFLHSSGSNLEYVREVVSTVCDFQGNLFLYMSLLPFINKISDSLKKEKENGKQWFTRDLFEICKK